MSSQENQLSEKLLARLEAIVGEAGMVTGSKLAGRSAGIWSGEALQALALVRPANTDEVSAVMKACHEAGFTPNVSYAPNEMQTILAYVAAGLGVSLVPQSLSGFHPNSIVYRPLRGGRVLLELALVRKRDNENLLLNNFYALASEVGMEYASRFRKTL